MMLPTVKQCLLHREPMIFIDRILSFDAKDNTCLVDFEVKAEALYMKHGRFQSQWGTEIMAQAAAIGFFLRSSEGGEIPRGYLVGIDSFEVSSDIEINIGDTIQVKSYLEVEVEPFGLYKLSIIKDQQVYCQAKMKFVIDTNSREL